MDLEIALDPFGVQVGRPRGRKPRVLEEPGVTMGDAADGLQGGEVRGVGRPEIRGGGQSARLGQRGREVDAQVDKLESTFVRQRERLRTLRVRGEISAAQVLGRRPRQHRAQGLGRQPARPHPADAEAEELRIPGQEDPGASARSGGLMGFLGGGFGHGVGRPAHGAEVHTREVFSNDAERKKLRA